MCEGWKNEDKRTLRYKLVLPYHFTCVRESSWKMNVYMSSTLIQSHDFFYEKAYVKMKKKYILFGQNQEESALHFDSHSHTDFPPRVCIQISVLFYFNLETIAPI